ncbi:MAG: YecH family protein [Paludibacteraceae bacterium]|nr:YecH family protein [Paludibacteraceae bacterium]
MTHGHEVLHMMEGNTYSSNEELIEAIIQKFGTEERFYTCSTNDMTASELVAFLNERGKFMPSKDNGFTVDTSKVCNH